jgi:phosphate transport system permease protein
MIRNPNRALRTETILQGLLLAATAVAVFAVAAIFGFLGYFSLPLFTQGTLGEIISWHWRPFQGNFGILPMMAGSLILALTALCLSYPLGLGLCGFVFLFRRQWPGRLALALIHFMTSIPTVVYGFVAAFLLVPLVRQVFGQGTGFCWLSAALILALLILPTIVLLLHSQTEQLRPQIHLTAMALGFNPAQEFLSVLLPLSGRGLAAAAVLGFGRAMGDTLVALMLSGNAPQVPHSPLDSLRTLTAHIALMVATDSHSLAYHSIFACGLILFGLAAAVNLTLRWLSPPAKL